MTTFDPSYIPHEGLSLSLLYTEIQGPPLTICYSKPCVGVSREWTETIHGQGRGYYLSGHGSLHIFHGSQGVFSQLLEDHIHLKTLWVTCDLQYIELCWKANEIRNKRDEIWQAIKTYRPPSYIWYKAGSYRISPLSLRRGLEHWQTRWHLSVKCS